MSIEDQLEQRLRADSAALARLADRMSNGIENSRSSWERDAGHYVSDAAEYQAIEWISPQLKIKWVVPRAGNENVFNIDLTFESRRKEALGIALSERKLTVSQTFELVQGGRGFIVYAPIYRNGQFSGLIAGVLNTSRFIDSLPAVLRGKYNIRVFDGSIKIYENSSHDPLSQPSHSIREFLQARHPWQLVVAPNDRTLASISSPLSTAVLVLGWIVAAIVGACVLLWKKAKVLGEKEKEARKFSETLSESSIDMIFVTDLEKMSIAYCNKVGLDYLGVNQAELAEISFDHLLERVHPEDRAFYIAQRQKYESLMNGEVVEVELRLLNQGGEYRWIHFHRQVITRNDKGDVKYILGTGHDVTERHNSESASRQAYLALEEIVDKAPIGMALAGLDGSWLRINRSLCELLGYSEEELIKLHFSEITHPEDLENDYTMMEQMLRGSRQGFSKEKRLYRKDGSTVWILLNAAVVRDANAKPLHFIAQMLDISDRKRFEADMRLHKEALEQEKTVLSAALEKAEVDSKVDPLTGLFNRRWFEDQLQSLAMEDELPAWSLIMLDVDHFKNFNDSFGHATGDRVLQAVGKTIKEHLRGSDTAARYGGEEFVIFCRNVTPEVAANIAERVRLALYKIDEFERSITASFGVAAVKIHGATPQQVLSAADEALYVAKGLGRDRVCMAEVQEIPLKSA